VGAKIDNSCDMDNGFMKKVIEGLGD
jgi:hypothetical protein